jgi:hypothetical protein
MNSALTTLHFFVNVTGYRHQPALGPSADSDWDCYGYTEIDWECTTVEDYDDEGDQIKLTEQQEKSIVSEYSELIEEKLLEIMKDEAESQDYDYFDDGYNGY